MSTNPGSAQPMGGFAPRAMLEEQDGWPPVTSEPPPMPSVPPHYDYGAYEPMLVADAWGLTLRLGYALKYICRRGNKPGGDLLEDLRKARNCIDLEIKRLENG